MDETISQSLETLKNALEKNEDKKNFQKCSLWKCIGGVLTRYPFNSEQERALIRWDRSHGDFSFLGNSLLTTRMLNNLIKNALEQISKNQKGSIFLSTSTCDGYNILHFKDTGGGADPETVPYLFKGFHTTKKEGTGLVFLSVQGQCTTLEETFLAKTYQENPSNLFFDFQYWKWLFRRFFSRDKRKTRVRRKAFTNFPSPTCSSSWPTLRGFVRGVQEFCEKHIHPHPTLSLRTLRVRESASCKGFRQRTSWLNKKLETNTQNYRWAKVYRPGTSLTDVRGHR